MFSLVLWITDDPVTSSTVSADKVKTKKSKTLAQWGKDWYDAKVVLTGNDVDYLNSLVVDVDGNIMTPERRLSFPDAVISTKRKIAASKRKLTAIKAGASAKSDTELLKTRSIFSDESSNASDEEINTVSKSKKKKIGKEQDAGREKQEKAIAKSSEKNKPKQKSQQVAKGHSAVNMDEQASIEEHEDVSDDRRNAEKSVGESVAQVKSEIDPLVEASDEEDADAEKENASDEEDADAEKENEQDDNDEHVMNDQGQDGSANDREPAIRDFLVSNEPKTGKVRLLKGFSIYIEKAELNYMKSTWRHKPQELTRRLMKLIVGKDKLRNMTATGKAKTPMIPPSVFKAVFLYVNKKTPENVEKLTEKQYRRVLTNMCNTLRNPKKPSTTTKSRSKK